MLSTLTLLEVIKYWVRKGLNTIELTTINHFSRSIITFMV
jgi:hypothetical protein